MPTQKKVEQVMIDECLFGQSRRCPAEVWEAVLSTCSASSPVSSPSSSLQQRLQPHRTIDQKIHYTVNDIGSLSNHQIAARREVDMSGIDDLDQGRWGSAQSKRNLSPATAKDHAIRLSDLRRLASQGIVDQGSHRAVAWRVLLGYLPPDVSEWKTVLLEQRTLYRNLVGELFVEPEHDGNELRGHHGKKQAKAQRQREYMERMKEANRGQQQSIDEEGEEIILDDTETTSNTEFAQPNGELQDGEGKTGLGTTPDTENDETNEAVVDSDANEVRNVLPDEEGESADVAETGVEPVPTEAEAQTEEIEGEKEEDTNPQDAGKEEEEVQADQEDNMRPPDLSRAHTDSEPAALGSNSDDEIKVNLGMDKTNVVVTSGQRRRSFRVTDIPEPLSARPAPEQMLTSVNGSSSHEGNDTKKTESKQKEPVSGGSVSDFDFKSTERRSLTRTADDWLKNNSNASAAMNGAQGSDKGKEGALEVETQPEPKPSDKVPAEIREEWKRSGRDTRTLDDISRADSTMNTLLVNENPKLTGPRSDRVAVHDDPLSTDSESKWFQFFENASLLDEIRKDVVRTHPDLYFFLEPENNLGQRRYAALERILFVWAKLNKGVRYVQGMNEIIGTLYFVLANDFNEEWACEAEADSYFLFNILMTEMRDVFVPDMDEADTGIQGRISNMSSLLSLHDPEVRCHLVDIGIDASFFAIRWLTTLLSREFLLPDTIRLWDSMFASTHKDNFLRYVCVTMVMLTRDDLLKGDFSTCLRLLQSYPPTNVDGLLESSRALWIYESQVTLACHKGGISLHQALNTITPPPSIIMAYGLPGGMAKPAEPAEPEPTPSSTRTGFFNRGWLGRDRGRSRGQG